MSEVGERFPETGPAGCDLWMSRAEEIEALIQRQSMEGQCLLPPTLALIMRGEGIASPGQVGVTSPG